MIPGDTKGLHGVTFANRKEETMKTDRCNNAKEIPGLSGI